jgi:hypothetical protein
MNGMRLLLIMLAFAAIPLTAVVAGGPQSPRFAQISVGMSEVTYIDMASIVRQYVNKDAPLRVSSTARARFVFDWPDIDEAGCWYHAGKNDCSTPIPITSKVLEVRFDCLNHRSIATRFTTFRGHMGTGSIVDDIIDTPGSASYVWQADYDTPRQQWEQIACDGFPERYRPDW